MKAKQAEGGFNIKCHEHGEHFIPTPRWGYNGNADAPTFTPSVKVSWDWGPVEDAEPGHRQGYHCCHFNVTDGKIIYHGDCTHKYAGQTLDLLEYS
jgi:hypothetical protein